MLSVQCHIDIRIFDMLRAVQICHGVFQGDTMSPITFILAFNPSLRLAEVLNHGYGFHFKLMVPGSHHYPPINAYIYHIVR